MLDHHEQGLFSCAVQRFCRKKVWCEIVNVFSKQQPETTNKILNVCWHFCSFCYFNKNSLHTSTLASNGYAACMLNIYNSNGSTYSWLIKSQAKSRYDCTVKWPRTAVVW